MKEHKAASNVSINERLLHILLPLGTFITVVISQLFTMHAAPNTLIKAVIFVICYNAILTLYLETNKPKFESSILSVILLISVPAIGFYASCITVSPTYSIVMIVLASLLGVIVDLPIAIIDIFAVFAYTLLFSPLLASEAIGTVIITVLLCLLSECEITHKTPLISSFIILICTIIVVLVQNDLVLNVLWETENILFTVLTVSMNILCYILKKLRDDGIVEESLKNEQEPNNESLADLLAKEVSAAPGDGVISSASDNKTAPKESETLSEKAPAIIQTAQDPALLKTIEDLQNEVNRLRDELTNVNSYGCSTIEEAVSLNSDYAVFLKKEYPRLFKHCIEVARISSEAAELIGCDPENACAISIYHEARRVLGEDYINILRTKFRIPKFITKAIVQIKNKDNNVPMLRETGIVLLADDIINTLTYLKNNNKDDISLERIITNTFKVRNDQNTLRLAGFSKEEIQLLKLYYNDIGGSYDTGD